MYNQLLNILLNMYRELLVSNSVRLLIAQIERCFGKQTFLKNSWSIKLSAPSLVKVLEMYLWRNSVFVIILLILLENELLYNFEEILSQFCSKQLTGWVSICNSYMWCIFWFDTICFIKKCQNHLWKSVIFR